MGKNITKNIILFAGRVTSESVDSIRRYEKESGKKFKIASLCDVSLVDPKASDGVDILISWDGKSDETLKEALSEYKDKVIALTCRGEKNIPLLKKIIRFFPNLNTPSVDSLTWSTDKVQMRKKFNAYDPKITPKFMLVENYKKSTLKKIKDKIGYPVVVKPAGLQASLLVSVCFYEEELERTLKAIDKKIKSVYSELKNKNLPKILVEQFMEGEIYSTDVYVDKNKSAYFTPFVHSKNGRSIGFDDFFEYQLITPSGLNKNSQEGAREVAKKAIKALDLFNISAHIELMKTEDGWKVIEVGPRIGGFRNQMYAFSYDINHLMNDILNRMGRKPIIPKKVLAHTAVIQFYAKKEGTLKKINGVKKIQELSSFKKIKLNKKNGDMCKFAKNGGGSICYVILSNSNKSDLLGDLRRVEQYISLEVE